MALDRSPGHAPPATGPRPDCRGATAGVLNLFICYSRNTGHSFWVYWAPFFLAGGALVLGIPVYAAQRSRLTLPAPVPAYR
jgi:hypothetical protein